MNTATAINLLSTLLLTAAMYRQVLILLDMKENDPLRLTKLLFPVFNVCIVAGMWSPYFNRTLAAACFFLIAAGIAAWTYYHKPKT